MRGCDAEKSITFRYMRQGRPDSEDVLVFVKKIVVEGERGESIEERRRSVCAGRLKIYLTECLDEISSRREGKGCLRCDYMLLMVIRIFVARTNTLYDS